MTTKTLQKDGYGTYFNYEEERYIISLDREYEKKVVLAIRNSSPENILFWRDNTGFILRHLFVPICDDCCRFYDGFNGICENVLRARILYENHIDRYARKFARKLDAKADWKNTNKNIKVKTHCFVYPCPGNFRTFWRGGGLDLFYGTFYREENPYNLVYYMEEKTARRFEEKCVNIPGYICGNNCAINIRKYFG